MQTLTNIKTRIRQIDLAKAAPDIGVAIGMVVAFLLGCKIASGVFVICEDIKTLKFAPLLSMFQGATEGLVSGPNMGYCFTVAFVVFMVSYFIAYSAITTYRKGISSLFDDNMLWLYRFLALIQAVAAGVMINSYRLDLANLGTVNNPAMAGARAVFQVMSAVIIAITLSTWLVRYLKSSMIALMPILVFVGGTLASSIVSNSAQMHSISKARYIFGSADYIFYMMHVIDGPLSLTGELLLYSAYASIYIGFIYAVARPYRVFGVWNGRQYGSALNGFIAATIVIFPYFSSPQSSISSKTIVPSVTSAILFNPSTLYSYLVWSWIIANAICFAPPVMRFLRRKRQVVTKQAGVQQYGGQGVAPSAKVNKVEKPSEDNKRKLLGSLHGQQDALLRLWNSTIYPVLNGDKQFGNALLLGPTGVGKTETAKKIADIFYGGRLLRFDMNQYGTETEATRLFGSAPGYVGSEHGGELPNGIRDMSPCVILLDEIEKVHPTLLQTLLQLCGEAYVKDSKGQRYDADRSIILMTSNIWPDRANELWNTPQDKLKKSLKEYISNRFASTGPVQLFSPEFIGRVNTVAAYKPFSKEIASEIILDMIANVEDQKGIRVSEGSEKALVESIDISEGFRGLQNSFDETVRNFITNAEPLPRGSALKVEKRAGKIVVALTNASGEVIKEQSTGLQKGYAIDAKKLQAWETSPLSLVLGQESQIREIVEHLKVSASGFTTSPNKPMGIFLLAGPTGVGKTETARALATWLFDGRLIKKDMGEYKSPYDGHRLFGDRNKMGDLTKEVQETGSCVVLLDEIEKANPEGVLDTLLSLFDDGMMNDAAVNIKVSFKNTIIIMTTNLEPDSVEPVSVLSKLPADSRRDLFAYHFKKELLGRINKVLLYNELSKEAVALIIRKRVEKIITRKKEDEGISITIDDAVYTSLSENIQASAYGVRGADEIIANTLGPVVASAGDSEEIRVGLEGNRVVAQPAK